MVDRSSAPRPFATLLPAHGLLSRVQEFRSAGWRLVTASTVLKRDGRRVLYHFERADELTHLEVRLRPDDAVPSIGSIFPGSFLVENEMQELQGLRIEGLAIDYGGRLFRDFDGIESLDPEFSGQSPTPAVEVAGSMRLDACVPVIGEREQRATTTRVPSDGATLTSLGPLPGSVATIVRPPGLEDEVGHDGGALRAAASRSGRADPAGAHPAR